MDRLNENELDLKGLLRRLNEFNKTIQNDYEELEDESNDFLIYWNNLYQQVLQQYSVINSSLLFQGIRDLIMVLSSIYSLQGNTPPEINICNNSDSKVEIEITDD